MIAYNFKLNYENILQGQFLKSKTFVFLILLFDFQSSGFSKTLDSSAPSIFLPASVAKEIRQRRVSHLVATQSLSEEDALKQNETIKFVEKTLKINIKTKSNSIPTIESHQRKTALDLALFMGEGSSVFQISFHWDGHEQSETSGVFFVPALRPQAIDGVTWGNECGKVLEFSGTSAPWRGLDVYYSMNQNRHALVLSGQYIFYGFSGQDTHLSILELSDSRVRLPKCIP